MIFSDITLITLGITTKEKMTGETPEVCSDKKKKKEKEKQQQQQKQQKQQQKQQ